MYKPRKRTTHKANIETQAGRLRYARERRGLSQAEVAKMLNIRQSTVAHLERTDRPGSSRIIELAKIYQVSLEWIRYGVGEIPNGKNPTNDIDIILPNVPLFSLSNFVEYYDNITALNDTGGSDYMSAAKKNAPKYLKFMVRDESMISPHHNLRSFRVGDIILVDINKQAENGNYVVSFLEGDKCAALRQYVENGKKRILKVLNPTFEDVPFTSKTRIAGVCTQHIQVSDI